MNDEKILEQQRANPKAKANILSCIFFWWVNPIMSLGYQRDLQVEDLYRILPEDDSHELGLKLEKEWNKELAKLNDDAGVKNKKKQPSLFRALLRTFGVKFAMLGILAFIGECIANVVGPVFLGQLLRSFDPESQMTTETAYLYGTGVVFCLIVYIVTEHPYFFECQHTGMQIRVASCSLLYKKCLRLSQKALGQTSVGQMVNIMSNDVNRFDLSTMNLHFVWVGPIQTLITAVILCYIIGPSCLVGLAVLILFIPLQGLLSRVFSRLRLETAKRTDERIRTMNEVLSGMRVIKMYTWEKPFAKLVELCRRNEVKFISKTACYQALNMSLFITCSKLTIFLTILVFVLSGNALTAEQVFLTVAFFNVVRITMTLWFPTAIAMAAEAWVSTKRIEKFLLLDEMTETPERVDGQQRAPLDQCKVDLKQVTVKWPAASEAEGNTLKDISLSVRPGQVLAVVGQVGSGKSSLLNVILGELSLLKGSRQVTGRISYASQEPWIFSGTIRQNILCGLDYDERRYNRVVQAAALERDFRLFPQGDATAVGERGVSLSGGQKARVNLARCLYVDADIYLLDDPLSAVDTHVGRHLFDQAVNGFLRDKIRVLVTHQLQYLKDANEILVLNGGRMEALGTYQEISRSDLSIITKALEEEVVEEDVNTEGKPLPIEDQNVSGFPRSKSVTASKRRNPNAATTAQHNHDDKEEKPAFAEESRSSGSVTLSVYFQYFRAGLGFFSALFLVINFLIGQILFHGSEYWLAAWTNAEELRGRMKASNSSVIQVNNASTATESESGWRIEDMDTYTGIYVFTGLTAGVFIFSIIRTVHLFVTCILSSIKLHNDMFQAIIRAPLQFFDENPVGRILNRFSKDIGLMDERLPATYFDVISIPLTVIGIVALVALANAWLILPIIVIIVIIFKLRNFFLKTAQNIKRLEATTKSPVFTHLSSSLVGLTTVRAIKCQDVFQCIFDRCQDVHSSAWYLYLATTRWLCLWMDWLCVVYVACVTYTCVALRDSITGSDAGLAISSAISLTVMVQYGVRQSAEMENQMTSVERVIEYGNVPSEAATESSPDKKPKPDWPQEGNIQFDQMSLRYNKSELPVLKNISCQINSQEKIGIVGRTGAGKSSLIASLFRLTEPDGKIVIDGIETKSIGLHDLRSKVSIIPQDPVLFSGSMRQNLDPFGEFNDELLWNALEDVKLKESLAEMPAGLDFVLTEGGSNLSVGQRQLVCLGRAILRRNRILVLDEATANVDQKTDSLIQLTIRENFKNCTVLTIAHRLNTIMDSDRVMVMDAGKLMEFDEPAILLENPDSIFSSLVEQTGPSCAAQLKDMARKAAEQRRLRRAKSIAQKSSRITNSLAKKLSGAGDGTDPYSYTNKAFYDDQHLSSDESDHSNHKNL